MLKRVILPAIAAIALTSSSLPALAAHHGKGDIQNLVAAFPSGPDHGMPMGIAGGDGAVYTGAPDLQVASSLVAAGGAPGAFSIVAALTAMAGPAVATAEVQKLTQQYGERRVASYVIVQNFAVDDAVRAATAAGVTLPAPALTGAALAKQEGFMLDHVVSNKVHDVVMSDIDAKYGTVADANYHLISNQAHYDLAQALGATTVKLAAYH